MAKKVFYNKRRKVPKGLQIYLVWFIALIILSPFIIFLGTDKLQPAVAAAPPEAITGKQAAILYYKTRDSKPAERQNVIRDFLKQLQITGYKKNSTENPDNSSCVQYIFTRGITNRAVILAVPFTVPDFSEYAMVRALSLAENLARSESDARTGLVFYDHACAQGVAAVLSGGEKSPDLSEKIRAVIWSLPGKETKILGDGLENVSSQFWQNIFPMRQVFQLTEHFYGAVIKAGHAAQILGDSIPAYTLHTPGGEKFGTAKAVVRSHDLLGPFLTILAQKDSHFANSGMWLSQTRHFRPWALKTLAVMFFLLLFFPVMHAQVLRKENLSMIDGVLSIFLFSFPVIVFTLILRSGGRFAQDKTVLAGVALLVAFVLYLLIRRVKNKVFSFRMQGSSVVFVLGVVHFPLLFINCGWLFITVPVILILSVTWRANQPLSFFTLLLAVLLVSGHVFEFLHVTGSAYDLFVTAFDTFNLSNVLYSVWFCLIAGGMLALTVREKR